MVNREMTRTEARPLLRALTATGIAIGCTIGGCGAGAGIGYVITGSDWGNLQGGIFIVSLLALVLGFFGLLAGAFLAARHDAKKHRGPSADTPDAN